jgi:hypothetical protein
MVRFEWSPWSTLLVAASSLHLLIAAGALHYSDFSMIHATGTALRDGRPAYEPVLLNDGLWRNMNPPQLNLLTWPLAAAPLPLAAQIFRLVNLAALACGVLLVLSPGELRSRRGGWILAAAIASPALVMQAGAGQVAGILSLVAAAAWRWVGRGRWVLAGAAIGILCALKPFFAPLTLWLAISGRWRACCTATLTAAGLVLLSVAVWGLQPQLDWLQAMSSVTWFDSRFNMGWTALALRLLGRHEPFSSEVAVAVSVMLAVLLAVASARMKTEHAFLQLCTVSIFATPLGWLYYLCVPGPLLMRFAYDGGRWSPLVWLLWIPLPLVSQNDTSYVLRLTLGSLYAWGMVALTGSILRDGYRRSNR